jgi:hypothetical protein
MPARTISTHCDFHLGDNLAHLHFLRKLAQANPDVRFIHAAHGCHLGQLAEVSEGIGNIGLILAEDRAPDSMDVWKNAGGFWQDSPVRNDYAGFALLWFARLARQMGLRPVLHHPADLLFDYPATRRHTAFSHEGCPDAFDFLLVNSRPCSGQYLEYDCVNFMDPLIADLLAAGHSVLVTQKSEVPGAVWTGDAGLFTVGQIGSASRFCTHHVMVSTGPSWPVLNIWNTANPDDRLRLILAEHENINIDPRVETVKNMAAVRSRLLHHALL